MRVAAHVLLAMLLFVTACGPSDGGGSAVGTIGGEPDSTSGTGGRFALLTVSSSRAGLAASARQVGVRGLFVAHAGLDRQQALAVLGAPQLLDLPPVGGCVLVHEERDVAAVDGGDELWIDLLDAGDVEVAVARESVRLDYQYFPDVVPFVSGVTYAGGAVVPMAGTRATTTPVRLVGRGGGEVGGFVVRLDAPAPVRLQAVGGRRTHAGYVHVSLGEDLDVRWDGSGDREEPMLLELSRHSFGATETIRCVVEDDGSFKIPGTLWSQLPVQSAPATVRLTARRTASAEFYAQGIDEGWAFFVSEDFVLLQ